MLGVGVGDGVGELLGDGEGCPVGLGTFPGGRLAIGPFGASPIRPEHP